MAYSNVVSRDSVCILITTAHLNNPDILAFNMGNMYLHTDAKKKPYFVADDKSSVKTDAKLLLLSGSYMTQIQVVSNGSVIS